MFVDDLDEIVEIADFVQFPDRHLVGNGFGEELEDLSEFFPVFFLERDDQNELHIVVAPLDRCLVDIESDEGSDVFVVQ